MSAASIKRAISVKPFWAWLIVNGWKNIENRDWSARFRGEVLIHASVSLKRSEYEACQLFIAGFSSLQLPPMDELQSGGIVGAATVLDCVRHHSSEWFCGAFGFVLADQRPLPFHPCKGSLGFFRAEYPHTISDAELRGAGVALQQTKP